jgi:hypothetical protein
MNLMSIQPWDQVLEQAFLLMYHVPGLTWDALLNMGVRDRIWLFDRTHKQLDREVKAMKNIDKKGK